MQLGQLYTKTDIRGSTYTPNLNFLSLLHVLLKKFSICNKRIIPKSLPLRTKFKCIHMHLSANLKSKKLWPIEQAMDDNNYDGKNDDRRQAIHEFTDLL